MTMHVRKAVVTTGMILAVVGGVVGCGEVEKAVNRGGDTKCSEYTKQDADKKDTTVTKYLEEDGGENNPPNQNTIDLAVAAIDLMCGAQANPDTPIRDADLAGIVAPK
ncbi:hypothetical protein [Nocardia lasii]|uniref:Acid stress chaperone HdeA n=1 Tax=Nocardia lasii TaxID=1616107 RepID=A0ABW1JNI4_9NOCA